MNDMICKVDRYERIKDGKATMIEHRNIISGETPKDFVEFFGTVTLKVALGQEISYQPFSFKISNVKKGDINDAFEKSDSAADVALEEMKKKHKEEQSRIQLANSIPQLQQQIVNENKPRKIII